MHVHPDESVRSAIALLKEFGVSQMPVVKAEPPLALAEVVGSVSDRSLLERAFQDPDRGRPARSARSWTAPLPTIGMGETVDVAAARLQHGGGGASCSTTVTPSASSPDPTCSSFWSSGAPTGPSSAP